MGKRKYNGENEDSTNKKTKNDEKVELAESAHLETNNIDENPKRRENKSHSDHVFNIKHFRKELAAKQGQTIALTQFLQVCLNPSNEVDYMLEYLKTGGNSHEILRQISPDNKKNLTLATPTFHLFHLIILKVQSSLPHMITITEEACRYFLNTYMPTVEIMVSENSGPRHRKIILNLLTSIVTLNPDLGIEVLNQAPLNPKTLHHVVERQSQKEKDNVRTAFVHFMTSFLVDGHLPLIKALLEKQGLLPLVLPGLIQDEPDAVLMFLNILDKNVVKNTFITKSSKLKTFGHQVLHNMFKIFSWKGPSELSAEVRAESRVEITKLLSEILLTLFTSHRLGLYFTDKYLGTSDANKNANLYKAILTLKRPWENQVECETILQIIYQCPDLHRALVNVIEQSFEPQHSPIWEKTVGFVMKLLDKLKPEEMTSRMDHLSSLQGANFVRFVTLPIPLLKFINTSLGKDHVISIYCVKVLVKMLQTLRRYMQILEMDNLHTKLPDLKNRLEYFIPKHLPSPAVLVSLIHDVIDQEKKTNDNTTDYKLPTPEKSEALINLVELLLLYNDVHPDFFESLEGNLNMKKLLDYSATLTEGNVSHLKFKIVSLWLIVDSSASSLQNPMFKDLFNIILEVYTSEDDNTWRESKSTLYNFFKSTAIFEIDEVEIDVMLYTLRNAKINPITLVGDIVEYVLENGKELNDDIKSQTVNFEISDGSSEASLDKLFNDLMENKITENSIFLENKIPSAFILGGIQFMQNNKEFKRNLKHFLSLYVGNLLHSNYSPELTEVLIGDSKLEVRNYVASWIGVPVSLPESVFEKDKVLGNISKAIIDEEDILLLNIFECLEICSENESDVVISEISYKINCQEPIDSSDLMIWAKYLIFCLIQLSNINQLKKNQQEKISQYIKCLIAIGKKNHLINVCRNIVLTLFKNRHFLKIYRPLDDGKNESGILATELFINIVEDNADIVSYLDSKHSILRSYQEKNYTDIIKALIKINKKKNLSSDHTLRVLQIVGLTRKDDVLVLKQIFSTDIDACVKDDREPSLVLEILRILIEKYSKSTTLEFTQDVLRKTVKLYLDILTNKEMLPNLTNLENALIKYFENKPQHAIHVNADFFKKFFVSNISRKSTSNLASTLLKLNVKLCSVLKEELKKNEIIIQREITLPIGNAILDHNQFIQENKDILIAIYNEYRNNIIKVLEKPHKAGQIYISCWAFINKLILECMDAGQIEKFFTKTHKFETAEMSHIYLLNTVFMKLCILNSNNKCISNYLISLLNLLTLALKENKDIELVKAVTTNIYTAMQICKHVNSDAKYLEEDFKKIIEGSVWQNFCKAVLKDSLKVRTVTQANVCGPQLLSILTTLVNDLYPQDHQDVETLFDMVTSHSEFLNVMLSHHSSDVKSRLIEFVFALMKKNKSVMKTPQIPVFLSAYHATRSPCDRLVLSILYHYESNGLPVNEYKPYVWGDSAANHYAVRKNRTSTLWGHPTPNQVLNLFEKDILERTVRNFPVTQKLTYHYELPAIIPLGTSCASEDSVRTLLGQMSKDKVFKLTNKDNEATVKGLLMKAKYECVSKFNESDIVSSLHLDEDQGVYDPVFVFSLLSHLLAPGSVASCFKLLRTGVLSVPVIALSSHCPMMRAAAYHVLHRFWLLLETETRHKNDKLFLTDFINTLRQSLTTAINNSPNNELKNPKLPAIDALYLAKGLMVSTIPLDPLYKPVNNFLIAKQFVDMTLVPDFLSLFHDSDVEAADRRLWILDIIKDGTKTMTDVNVVFKTMCLKMIMDFYSSVLGDRKTREKILSALNSLISIPRCCEILVEGYGFMSWLHGVVRQLGRDDRALVKELVDIIQNVIHSFNINAFAKHLATKANTNGKVLEGLQLKINKELEHEILIILYNLLYYIDETEIEEFLPYIRVYTLISRRTIKMLNKKQILHLISKAGATLQVSECVDLLKKVLVTNNPIILKSDVLVNDKSELIAELTVVVDKYIV